MKQPYALGIDIGGSGIKGAIVDLEKGQFASDRLRIPTPQPATPEAVAQVVRQIVDHFATDKRVKKSSAVGITVPAVVTHGVTRSAANIDPTWVDAPALEIFSKALDGRDVVLVNDADAAGLAESRWGAAKDQPGLVIVTTLGTGIGSAVIYNGVLIPNSEFGHLELDGHDAESRAAASIKDLEGLSYEQWATERLQRYYSALEFLTWPDLIVVGGGVSKAAEKFLPLLRTNAPIVPAQLMNAAGIVGAARLAAERQTSPDVLVKQELKRAKKQKKAKG